MDAGQEGGRSNRKETDSPAGASGRETVRERPEMPAGMARKALAQARAGKAALRESVSFQLGRALVKAATSWRGVLALPSAAGRIRRLLRDREAPRRPPPSKDRRIPKLAASSSERPLRVAAITDAFTDSALGPECRLMQLRPRRWKRQLREFRPDLVFLESAWEEVDGLWKGLMEEASEEILGIIRHCRDAGISSLFWNKEDPEHYEDFLDAAREVDYVFTTDADCVGWYAWDLGHNRIFWLPFAA